MIQTNTEPINRLEYEAYKSELVKTDNGFQEYCKYCIVKIEPKLVTINKDLIEKKENKNDAD